MKVHYLQHVPFEGLGSIADWLTYNGLQPTCTHLYLGELLPDPQDIDLLIVMGGPMGVYDIKQFPWLEEERAFINTVVQSGAKVLGICLGAQLIASALDSAVYKGPHKEIGWFPVKASAELLATPFADVFPASFEAFHWHGDTFDIPKGAIPLGSSTAFPNQGFVFDNRVLGLQFHLETTAESAQKLIEHCGDELDGTTYVQNKFELLSAPEKFSAINQLMKNLTKELVSN